MKLNKLILAVAALLLITTAFAQKKTTSKDNLQFMVRQQEHIVQALKTVAYLQDNKTSSVKMGNAVIIVCGEAVKNLTASESTAFIEERKKLKNVSIHACGLSLQKFNLTEKDLPQGILYTPNGFVKAFELQKQGYLSVEL